MPLSSWLALFAVLTAAASAGCNIYSAVLFRRSLDRRHKRRARHRRVVFPREAAPSHSTCPYPRPWLGIPVEEREFLGGPPTDAQMTQMGYLPFEIEEMKMHSPAFAAHRSRARKL